MKETDASVQLGSADALGDHGARSMDARTWSRAARVTALVCGLLLAANTSALAAQLSNCAPLDALTETTFVKASNAEADDLFGHSVAMRGGVLVVGALQEWSGSPTDQTDNSALLAGAAYVFERSGEGWQQVAYLKASNVEAGDKFGHAVDVGSEYIAVGAPEEDSSATGVNGNQSNNGAPQSGAVYIFRREGGAWVQEAYLKADQVEASALWFGYSVALSEEGDTLVVGAAAYSGDSPSQGKSFIFERGSGGWSQVASLTSPTPGWSHGFGSSVDVAGSTIAIGESGYTDPLGLPAPLGAAHLYRRQLGSWQFEQTVFPEAVYGQMGVDLALSDDGLCLAAGAHADRSSSPGIGGDSSNEDLFEAGAVWIFERAGGIWSQTEYIKSENPANSAHFGWSLDFAGSSLAIGAYNEDVLLTGSGAVYIYERAASGWQLNEALMANMSHNEPDFGWSVAVDCGAVAIGSRLESSDGVGVDSTPTPSGANYSGSVLVAERLFWRVYPGCFDNPYSFVSHPTSPSVGSEISFVLADFGGSSLQGIAASFVGRISDQVLQPPGCGFVLGASQEVLLSLSDPYQFVDFDPMELGVVQSSISVPADLSLVGQVGALQWAVADTASLQLSLSEAIELELLP